MEAEDSVATRSVGLETSAARDADPVFRIRDLEVEFGSGAERVRAVRGVSYDVRAGETLAIVGETGSGKTVSALAALGLLGPTGHVTAGAAEIGGRDLLRMSERERRSVLGSEVGVVFQEPRAALNPVISVGEQIAEALTVHAHLTRRETWARVIELLRSVGVPGPETRADQYPHQLSGGMCQRVVIAMAIANTPRLLIADEPTTAVDVTVQAQLLDLLHAAQRRTGAGMVLITHDLGVVAEVADRVCVMYAGRIVETASVEQLFEDGRHPYTSALLRCIPRIDVDQGRLEPIPGQPPDLRLPEGGCAFASRCDRAVPRCLEERPELVAPADGGNRLAACHFRDDIADRAPAPRPAAGRAQAPGQSTEGREVIVAVKDVVKDYPVHGGMAGRRGAVVHAVSGVSFDVRAGETLGLVGESGSGKTTVGLLVMRLIEATRGSVVFKGRDVTRASSREMRGLRREVQMVFQDPFSSLNPRRTVGGNVAEPLRVQGTVPRELRARKVGELFGSVGLRPELGSRLPAEFSGGQRQRVGIARALAVNPSLVVLDEPVSALDVSVQAQVLNLLRELQRQRGLAYILISHDLSVVRHLCDRVAVMYLGRIVEFGSRERVYGAPLHPYTKALLEAVPVPFPGRRTDRAVLAGDVPSPLSPPTGCPFRTRCSRARDRCALETPALLGRPDGEHSVACHFPVEPAAGGSPVSLVSKASH